MLLDELILDTTNYAHVLATLNDKHEIIYNDSDAFIIHSLISNVYSIEIRNEQAFNKINDYLTINKLDKIVTTSLLLYEKLKDSYPNTYPCYQYIFSEKYKDDSHIRLISHEDLDYVINSYHNDLYIRELFDRNRILGYYHNGKIIGYVAHHIDGTVGALYVDPKFRHKGYGSLIMKAAVHHFTDTILYSHVLVDNVPSIELHLAIGATQADKIIYWIYETGFSYS